MVLETWHYIGSIVVALIAILGALVTYLTWRFVTCRDCVMNRDTCKEQFVMKDQYEKDQKTQETGIYRVLDTVASEITGLRKDVKDAISKHDERQRAWIEETLKTRYDVDALKQWREDFERRYKNG